MRRFMMICSILLITGLSAKGGGFAIYEASVRVAGMMGAYVANGNHVSTIFYNPAGLAQLSGINVAVSNVFINPHISFRGTLPSLTEYENEKRYNPVPNLYASYSINESLAVGLGVYVPFGSSNNWGTEWIGRGIISEIGLSVIVANPVVSYKLPDMGFGDIYIGGGPTFGVVASALLARQVPDFIGPDGSEGSIKLEGDAKDMPIGFNFGVLYKASDRFSIGFNYRSQLELNFEGNAEFSNLPASGFPPNTTGSLQIITPAYWTLGTMYKATNNLSLNFEYVWWGWSSYDELRIEFSNTTPVLSTSVSERAYEDVYQLRFGAEYAVDQVKGLTLRTGLGFDKNPIPDRTLDPTLPDTDRLLFSYGLSYDVTSMFSLDAYYTFVRGAERKVDLPEGVLNGYYNVFANLFGVGVTMKF